MKRLFNKFLPLLMLIVCSILGTTDAWSYTVTFEKEKTSGSYSSCAVSNRTVQGITFSFSGSDFKWYGASSGHYYLGASKTTTLTWTSAPEGYVLKINSIQVNGYKTSGSCAGTMTPYDGSVARAGISMSTNKVTFSPILTSGDKLVITTNAGSGWSTKEINATSIVIDFDLIPFVQFKAKAVVAAGSGKVCATFDTSAPNAGAYQTNASEATFSKEGAGTPPTATTTAYFYHQEVAGYNFLGWYNNDGNFLSNVNPYSYEYESSATTMPDQPQYTVNARFAASDAPINPEFSLKDQDNQPVAGDNAVVMLNDYLTLSTNTSSPTVILSKLGVVSYNSTTKQFTALSVGEVTVTCSQAAGDGKDAFGTDVKWNAGSESFTITVVKRPAPTVIFNNGSRYLEDNANPIVFKVDDEVISTGITWTLTSSNTNIASNASSSAPAITTQYKGGESYVVNYTLGFESDIYEAPATDYQVVVCKQARHLPLIINDEDKFGASSQFSDNLVSWNEAQKAVFYGQRSAKISEIFSFDGVPSTLSFQFYTGTRPGSSNTLHGHVYWSTSTSGSWTSLQHFTYKRTNYDNSNPTNVSVSLPSTARAIKIIFNELENGGSDNETHDVYFKNISITSLSYLNCTPDGGDVKLNLSNGDYVSQNIQVSYMDRGAVSATLSGADASHFAVGFANQSATTQTLAIGSEADEQTKQIYVKYLGTINGDNMATELARTATLTIQDEQGVPKTFNISFTKPNYITFAPAEGGGAYTVKYPDMGEAKAVASNNWYRIIQGNGNDVAALTATPASEQYVFEAWYVDGVKQGRENPWNVTLSEPKTITAKFLDKNNLPAPVYTLNNLDSKEVTLKVRTATDAQDAQTATISYISGVDLNYLNAAVSSANGGNVTFDKATGVITADRAGDVTLTLTQSGCEIYQNDEQTFTIHVVKNNPVFAWADPLPRFVVGQTLTVSEIFSFTPAACEANWMLTSDNESMLPSIAKGDAGLFMPKEVNGVTLTFHQAATDYWNEIENTSIKINVTKEPVVFNWKNPSLIAGNTYSWKDFVETNSEGAWNLVSDDESVIPTMRSIASTSATVAAGTVTLSFTQGQDLGHDAVSIQTKTFTVYPSNGIATFKVGTSGSTYTDDLADALDKASKLSSNKYVFVATDGVVLPGTYTIPSGVILVVPYESTNQTTYITKPKELANSTLPIEAYRTLKLVDGVTINVSGSIAVCAQVQSGDNSHNPSGFPVGPVGVIDMSKGGKINVKSGGTLYAWGFIKGEGYLDGNNTTHVGSVTAENNSTIWECFGMGDWNGGSFTYAAANNSKSYKIFPFQSYFVQNIEVPLHMKYGAQEKLYASFYANSSTNNTNITFISYGSNTALFLVTENSSTSEVVKRYDPTTDHFVVDLVGKSKLGSLDIKISYSIISVTASSKSFDLPIVNNMHVRLIDCDLSLTTPVKMFPGSVFEVTKGSKLDISTNIYVFDHDDWGKVVNKHYFGVTPKTLSPHVSLGDDIDVNTLEDAKIIVDGSVEITSGGIFTSPAGANIMGNGGGTFKWSGALPANATTNGYTLGASVDGSNTSSTLKTDGILTTTCNPAKLHNDNDSYTAAVGSKTFYNVNGRWFVQEDKDEKSDHTYNFKYLNDGNTVATPAVYTSDKTGLMAGYKWVNVALDNDFCGSKTFLGEDGNYYYYDGASKDAVSKWIQLVKLSDALYSGSDNNLYTFSGCAWASVGEIGDDCMYTVDGVKMALVGTEFIALEKDEYDEVYVDASGNYYMLFNGCVWQHATKIPDTYKAYEVLGNPYIWMGEEWVEVAAEGAYFYTVDDQGIKHFYEFDNVTFTWVPVRNKVRITTPTGDKRDFLTFDDAISYLSQYNDPMVTLLEDVVATKPQTIAPGSKSTTCTIDLNGHKVMASSTLQYMWQVSSTVNIAITDNSDKANGELHVSGNYAGQFRGFWVVKGGVQMDGGKLFVENTNTAQTVAAIYLPAGTHAVVNGGEIEAVAVKGAFGIDEASTAATNNAGTSYITITGGTMTGTATTAAYGVRCYCPITVSGGTINAVTDVVRGTAAASSAYGIYLNVSASAVDANSYRASLTMTGGTVNANSAVSTAYAVYANASATTANGKKSDGTNDNTYKPTDGTYSNKAAAHFDITGGSINATCGSTGSTACGIYDLGCYNSYTDKSEAGQKPNTIKNVKIRAYASVGTAYGILVSASIADYSAGRLYGNVIVDNVDSYAETGGSTNAYGIYINATAQWLNRYRYYNISAANRKTWYVDADNTDGDITHEAIAQTGTKVYKYQIGNHTLGAKAVVNSGTFYGKAGTTNGYGILVNSSASSGDNSRGYAEVTINGGTFTGESTVNVAYGLYSLGNTTVNGGTFNAITGTTEAYGVMAVTGVTTLKSGVVVNATSNGSTAAGVAASGTVDTNTGTHAHGTLNVESGVVVNARSLTSGTVYGAYATGSAQELTQAKYDARSADNKKQYFCVAEDGTTITTQATNATTNDSKKQNFYAYRIGTYIESGVVNVNGGTFNVNAYTSTAAGVATATSNIVRTTEIGRFGIARGTVNVNGGTFNVTTETGATAMGVRSYGIVNVEGGIFNMTPKTTNAEGVRVYDGTTTVNGGTFNINATTNTAYGVFTTPDWDTNYAFGYSGEIIVKGGTFNVKTYGGDNAYAAYSTGGTKNMKGAKVTGDVAKDYAVAGSITINGGEFTMTPSTGKNAYGMVVAAPYTLNAAKAYSRGTINGGFFKMVGTSSIAATGSSAVEDGEGVPQLQVKGGHFSTKANLEQASPKNYVRDPYNIIACVHPEYKKDYPFEVAEVCTITFKDDEDHTLWSGKQPKGTMAIYPLNNGTPEKAATSTNSYDFTGWETPLETITGDATYVANFTAVAKRFMVTWKDEAGNEIDHKEWASGQTPTHDDPVKEGYTFTGWTPSITAVVDADQNYKATFTINNYTIIWLDEDGSEIKRETKQYGSTLTAPKPTKEGYTFKVWTPGVEKVTGDQTYQASYLLNVAEVTDASTGKTTPYTTWADALKAANKLTAGGTLKVLDDIKGLGAQTFSQTFTLDLNGHTLASATSKFITLNTAGKTLTIDDSKGGGRIEMIGNSAAELFAVYVNNGTVQLNNGTIYCENVYKDGNDSYRGEAIRVDAAAGKFVMNGGRVEGKSKNLGYGIYAAGPVEVYGGEIIGTARTKSRAIYTKGATLIVKSAYLEASSTVTLDAFGIYSDTSTPVFTIDNVTIKATANTTGGYGLNLYSGNKGTISNVKIQATTAPIDADATNALSITSGFFDKETNLAKYIGTKKVVALVSEPEKAEGYNYKIVDAAYQVTFKAENGTVLQQTNVEKGLQPVYVGEAQTKASTPKYAYDFDGWMDASDSHVYTEALLPAASKDVVYTAHFAQRAVEYPITFSNIDGKGTDYVQMVAFDQMPVYDGPTPYMSGAVSNYAYTFIGWDPELAVVAGPASYSPRYDLVISHNVSFVTGNASAVTPTMLVVAEGAAVERPADQLVDCQHIVGWYKDAGLNEEWNFASDKLGEEDLILYAKWETKTYTITWLDEFGDEIDQTVVNCGVVPTHAKLYKPSTAAYSYEWKGWNKTIVAANADATYKSLGFNQVAKRYEIIFNTNGGSAIDPIQQEVGSAITAPADPTREGYTFAGWDKPIPATMPAEDMTITANWTINQYTITFNSNGGSAVASITQDYNTSVTAPADPTRDGYTFDGWDKEIPSMMPAENMTINAQWIKIETSLVVGDNEEVTITESTQYEDLTIKETGAVTTSGNAQVTVVNNLLLEATPDNNIGAVLSGNIQVEGDAYIDINMNGSGTMNKGYYYSFAVPFSVDVNGGVFRMEGTTAVPMTPGVGFLAYKYNEEKRATSGASDACWTPVSSGTFEPGVFYLILFSSNKSNTYRFKWNGSGSVNNHKNISVTTTGNDAHNSGWHGVANNGLGYTKMSGEFTVMQTLNSKDNVFESFTITDPIAMANPVFVQMASGTIDLSTPTLKAAAAPRRAAAVEKTELMNVRLVREGADKHDDQIFFSASEEAEDQYTLGKDVAKMFMGTAKTAQLWINAYGERLVANEAVMSNNVATADLSLYAPAAADYQLHLTDIPEDTRVYLTYEGQAIWNLSLSDYSISLPAGTTNGYGLRINKSRVATGLDEAMAEDKDQIKKVLINNVLYIIRAGRVYDANGKEIKR